MASVVRFFMGPEDEKNFLRDIAPLGLVLYPEVVPPDWEAPRVDDALWGQLEDESYYLGAPEVGPITIDKVKRGPNKGKLMILEVISPVIHYSRSVYEEDTRTLRSGRLWAELQVSGDVHKRVQKAPSFERTFQALEAAIARRGRKSQPVGHFVLPDAVRMFQAGTELREQGRKGELVRPYR